MDTQVRTPQAIFMQPQRLLVPLFQRLYVWSGGLHTRSYGVVADRRIVVG